MRERKVNGCFANNEDNIWPDRRHKFVSCRIFGSLLTRQGLLPAFYRTQDTALRGYYFDTCRAFRDLRVCVEEFFTCCMTARLEKLKQIENYSEIHLANMQL